MNSFDRQRGSILTEMAITLPVVLLVLLGAVDFGRAWVHANATANAAHAGAQFGSQSPTQAGNPAAIEEAARRDLMASSMFKLATMTDGNVGDSGDVNIESERYCMCDGGAETNCDTGGCGGGVPPQIYVRVRVNTMFEPLFDYPGIPSEIRIDRQASMRAR